MMYGMMHPVLGQYLAHKSVKLEICYQDQEQIIAILSVVWFSDLYVCTLIATLHYILLYWTFTTFIYCSQIKMQTSGSIFSIIFLFRFVLLSDHIWKENWKCTQA